MAEMDETTVQTSLPQLRVCSLFDENQKGMENSYEIRQLNRCNGSTIQMVQQCVEK